MGIYTINVQNLLVADFIEKKKTPILFLFLLIDMSIFNAMKKFYLYINNMVIDTNNVCIYYILYILFRINTLLIKLYPDFILVIKAAIIFDHDLNYCKRTNNNSHFYNTYNVMIVEKQISKFSSANCTTILFYQKYANIFYNLAFIEKVFIAYTYIIISIIKLRLSKTYSITFYH